MRTFKRNTIKRAYSHGYITGRSGRSRDICPHTSTLSRRQAWMNGWRAGWQDRTEGNVFAFPDTGGAEGRMSF